MLEPNRTDRIICATKTFQMMCESNDPWACTMFGFNLARGVGTEKDLDRALKVLPNGCRLAQDDPACVKAQRIMSEIEAALRAEHRPHQ